MERRAQVRRRLKPLQTARGEHSRLLVETLSIGRGRAAAGGDAKSTVVAEQKIAELGVAQTHCVLQHRLEDRSEIAGRARNNPKRFGSGDLLLERFG